MACKWDFMIGPFLTEKLLSGIFLIATHTLTKNNSKALVLRTLYYCCLQVSDWTGATYQDKRYLGEWQLC